MKLTVAIPTFDRPVQLRRTVEALLPQITDGVEVLILDNASPISAEEALSGLDLDQARVVRHPYNLGANGNILRCFEEASAPWIWVLGDDDEPRPDAVQLALTAIEEATEAIAISFNSIHGGGHQDFETTGRADLIARLPAFGNLLFISTNLFRREPLMEHLHTGYRYAYSMASHMAMLLMAAGTTKRVVFRDEVIVETETVLDGNHWSAINQALSIPTLLELPLTPAERKLLASRFQLPDLANLLIQLLGTGVRRGEFESSKFYYGQVAGRLWPYTPFLKRVIIVMGRLAFVFPQLSLKAANRVLEKRKGSSVMARLRAETFDPRI